jgi:hypothetical protein
MDFNYRLKEKIFKNVHAVFIGMHGVGKVRGHM